MIQISVIALCLLLWFSGHQLRRLLILDTFSVSGSDTAAWVAHKAKSSIEVEAFFAGMWECNLIMKPILQLYEKLGLFSGNT